MSRNSNLRIYIQLLLTAIFWGGTFIAAKAAAENVQPFTGSFLRFAIASVCLIILYTKLEGGFFNLPRKYIIPMIILGLSGVVSYNVFFFKGLKLIGAGRASLIIAMNPIFLTIFSALIFRYKLGILKIAGILISVLGALTVITRGNLSALMNDSFSIGDMFIFFCVLSWVVYTLTGKIVMKELSPLAVVTYSSIIGALGLLYPAYTEGFFTDYSTFSHTDWINLAYLGIFGTVIGFYWFYDGVRNIGPVKAGLFINFVPVSAIILSYFLLDEPVTISLFAGAIMVTTGVILTNRKEKQKTPALAID